MKAGFSQRIITPPLGCVMEGFNLEAPAASVHDDLHVRVVWLEDGTQSVLIVAADLLFLERSEMAVITGQLADAFGLGEAEIFVNFSHTHSGPRLTRWHYSGEPEPAYIDSVATATVEAAATARARLTDVSIHAGLGETALPISRRRPNAEGIVEWGPCASAPACHALPVCLLKDSDGHIVAGFFSVACHPTINHTNAISAEFPGIAVDQLNRQFGTDGFVFLQGGGGDTKPANIAVGDDHFRDGTWEDIREAGEQVANEVAATLHAGLHPQTGILATSQHEMRLDLDAPKDRTTLAALAEDETANSGRRAWAQDMLAKADRGALPNQATVRIHGLQLAAELVFIGVEAELGSELAELIMKTTGKAITFALGYTNGVRLNLPCDRQLPEGGYGVDTAWEFHWPAKLAPGIDTTVQEAVRHVMEQLQAGST